MTNTFKSKPVDLFLDTPIGKFKIHGYVNGKFDVTLDKKFLKTCDDKKSAKEYVFEHLKNVNDKLSEFIKIHEKQILETP